MTGARIAGGLRDLARLIRVFEVLLIVGGSFVGAHLAGVLGKLDPVPLILTSLANGLLFAASMALNDWRDVDEDAINKPHRPLPSGRIARSTALRVAITGFVAGTALSAIADPRLGLAAAAGSGASVGYSLFLKRIPLTGNLLCATITAYPLWCWLVIAEVVRPRLLVLTAALILFRLGAEILKTAEDARGDNAVGIRTIATCYGVRFALRLGSVLICLSLVPCWLGALLDSTCAVLLGLSTALACLALTCSLIRRELRAEHFIFIERAIIVAMAVAYGHRIF